MKSKIYLYFIIIIILNIKSLYQIENFKLSVIIPVYNVQRYLRECLKSIINQTYKNLEIICINDGSTDKSLEILKEFEKIDKRIKIFSQINKGVSSARNKGIELSTGQYITFVDSDDYLNLNVYKNSMNNIINNDIDVLSFDMKSTNKKLKRKKMHRKIYFNDNFKAMSDRGIYPSICNKIFRKKLITDYNIRFKEELYFGEDDLFRLMSFVVAKKISLLPNEYYIYRIRKNSSSKKLNKEKYLINNIKRFKFLIQFFNEHKINNKNDYLIEFALGITYKFIIKMKNKNKKKLYAEQILDFLENNLIKDNEKISNKNIFRLKKLKEITKKNKLNISDL